MRKSASNRWRIDRASAQALDDLHDLEEGQLGYVIGNRCHSNRRSCAGQFSSETTPKAKYND